MTNNRPTKQNIANYTEQHKPHNKIGVISGAHNKILDPALHLTPHFLRLYNTHWVKPCLVYERNNLRRKNTCSSDGD